MNCEICGSECNCSDSYEAISERERSYQTARAEREFYYFLIQRDY